MSFAVIKLIVKRIRNEQLNIFRENKNDQLCSKIMKFARKEEISHTNVPIKISLIIINIKSRHLNSNLGLRSDAKSGSRGQF
jgi:hypothetical protein